MWVLAMAPMSSERGANALNHLDIFSVHNLNILNIDLICFTNNLCNFNNLLLVESRNLEIL